MGMLPSTWLHYFVSIQEFFFSALDILVVVSAIVHSTPTLRDAV